MAHKQATQNVHQLYLGILAMFVLTMLAGCRLLLVGTYSIDEQYDISATRSVSGGNQLKFSIKLVSDHVPVDQDIFFVATFTNTIDRPIVFREPRQHGVIEAFDVDTTLMFVVEPINVNIPFQYPRDLRPDILVWPPVERDEFKKLPLHGTYETRLKLPRLVLRNGEVGDVISLPPGQYLVRMTYDNSYIGYEVQRDGETRYVDVGAWVGKVESNVVSLTITP